MGIKNKIKIKNNTDDYFQGSFWTHKSDVNKDVLYFLTRDDNPNLYCLKRMNDGNVFCYEKRNKEQMRKMLKAYFTQELGEIVINSTKLVNLNEK